MRCLSSNQIQHFFGLSVPVISEDKIGVKPLPSSGKSPKMGTAVTRPLVLSAYRYGKSVPKSQKNTLWHHHRAQYCPDYCSSSPTDISPPLMAWDSAYRRHIGRVENGIDPLLTHICICNTSPIWLRVSTVRCRDIAWRLFVGHPGPALWPFCKLCTNLMVEVSFPSWDREAFLNFAQLDFFSSGQRRAFYTELYFTIQSGRNRISLVIWRLQRQSNTLDYEYQKCFEDF